MTSTPDPFVQAATDHVAAQLSGVGRLGVAFSGGVDSSVLLALAVRALAPDRVVAILGVSPSLAADERSAAHAVIQASHHSPSCRLMVSRQRRIFCVGRARLDSTFTPTSLLTSAVELVLEARP